MASASLPNPSQDLTLTPLVGRARTLREQLTTFGLASIVIDPYTNESSWILDTAVRVLRQFSGADVRTNFTITCDADDARAFLGPYADEFVVFLDPDRSLVKGLGLTEIPAFVYLQNDGSIPASAQGWDAAEWNTVATAIAQNCAWSKPSLPAPGDPVAFRGTPALV